MRNTSLCLPLRSGLAAAAGALLCFGAMAQQPAAPSTAGMQAQLQSRFSAADANHDGQLTREEAQGRMPWVSKHFDAIDGAHAGSVTLAQIQAFAAQQSARRRAPAAQ